MTEYVEVNEARRLPGIRLALSKGQPGLWGQAVKQMLGYKGLPFVPVLQRGGEANEELLAWTGQRNAPVLVYDERPALSRWQDMIPFIDQLKPTPLLQPEASHARALHYGIINELAGEWGYGWCARLLIFRAMKATSAAAGEALPAPMAAMLAQYGYSDDAAAKAPARCADILRMLAAQLHAQRDQGSAFFVGSAVTAADIYWACFSNLLEPWPEWACDITPPPKPSRGPKDPLILAAKDPILIEHRDNMFRKFLKAITY
jgi:glutathione S-transferase